MDAALTTDYWNSVRDEFQSLIWNYGFTHFSFNFIPDITWLKTNSHNTIDALMLGSFKITTVPSGFSKEYHKQVRGVDHNFIKSMMPRACFIPSLHNNPERKIKLLEAWGIASNLVVVLENPIYKGWIPRINLMSTMPPHELQEHMVLLKCELIPELQRRAIELIAIHSQTLNPLKYIGFLPDRAFDILPLLAAGLSSKEIAREIHVSPSTVEYHTYNLMEKLQAKNRVNLVHQAASLGLI